MRADDLWAVRLPVRALVRVYEGDHGTASVVFQVLSTIGERPRLVRIPNLHQVQCACRGCHASTDVELGLGALCWECEQHDCDERNGEEQAAFHGGAK